MNRESLKDVREGVRAVLPFLLAVAPFGLVFGVTASAADVAIVPAWASSFVVFAGAAQIAIVDVMDGGGIPLVAFVTAVVINSRMLLYSADFGRYTAPFPWRVRLPAAYLLTDQAYLMMSQRYPDPGDAPRAIPFYFGAGVALWCEWQTTTTLGIFLGSTVPTSWSLEIAVPLTFLALLVVAVHNRPTLIAAITGGAVAVAAHGLPYGLGLIAGALAGIAVGMLAEERSTAAARSRP